MTSFDNTCDDICDDAADTLRFMRLDPDATSIYDITPPAVRALDHAEIRRQVRRRLIRATRRDVQRLREAFAEGWDIGPELAHEQRRLAALVAADRSAT